MTHSPIRLVFIGTGAFGCPILEKIAADEHFQITGVITAPDKPQGRKQVLTPTEIKLSADKLGLTVHTPATKSELTNIIEELKPDICLLVAYGMILPGKLLKLPRYGFINVHGSVLPKYRGASPIHQALLNGDSETGNSWTLMEPKLDAGPLIGTTRVSIDRNETFIELYKKLAHDAANSTPSFLLNYIKTGQSTSQDDTKATFCSLIDKNDGLIDFNARKAADIYNKFRAYIEWPFVYFKAKTMNIKIVQCSIYEQNNYSHLKPGTFINLNNKKLLVTTLAGVLELSQLQPPSKKAMPGSSFLQGYRDELENVVNG